MNSQGIEIESILFGIYSPEEVISSSVVHVSSNKTSGEGSVYDERMGSMDNNTKCVSCTLSCKECPGHFGHIELNYPVFHPMYYRLIINFLKCFCFSCYSFLLTEDHLKLENILKYQRELRFEKILEKMEKIDVCYHCDHPKAKIIFVASEQNIYTVFKKTRILVSEDDVKKVFDNVKTSDVRMLGFDPQMTHPRNLVLTSIPVLPPISRPYVVSDGIICDDDLTIQYMEIIKANNHLKEPGLNEAKQVKHIQTLRFRIKTLMNNSQGKARHTNGRPIKAIKERLSGKEGHIRNNLMGKRVNQSARTVIGPDPTVRTDEVVVPDKIAAILTVPERVTPMNIQELEAIVNRGGAQYVIRNGAQGRTNLKYAIFKKGTNILPGDIILREEREVDPTLISGFQLRIGDKIRRGEEVISDIELQTKRAFHLNVGDIVERNLRNGDIILFNRQPTLHKGSMLAKKVIIRPCKTLRFNLASTKTFNADFDGDEMNLHLPQDYDARAELQILSTTKANMISAQASKTNVSIIQDNLLGAYKMTIYKEKIPKDVFFNICMHGDNWSPDFILKKINHIRKIRKDLGLKAEAFTGKGLISLMLPNDFNYVKKNDADPSEPIVKIFRGVMYEGALNKSMLGASHNSIIQCLHKEYGMDVSMDFVNNIQFITNAFLLFHGFSLGIGDCIPKKTSLIQDTVAKSLVEAKTISETAHHPRIKEAKINSTLGKAKDVGMRIAKEAMNSDNAFISTVTSGSRGDFFNIAQIGGILGQQNVMAQRIQPVLNKNRRTLPHYKFGELNVEKEFESRGFIRHSFMKGLNPQEFFFHAMSGREGVSDTAMKTAQSGYIQRKMVKVLEDVSVKYDGTVRNSTGAIIQWAYGEDGLDRSNTVILQDKPEFCDISRLADKLNTKFEVSSKKK